MIVAKRLAPRRSAFDEVGPAKGGAVEIGLPEVGALERRVGEVAAEEVGAARGWPRRAGAGQVGDASGSRRPSRTSPLRSRPRGSAGAAGVRWRHGPHAAASSPARRSRPRRPAPDGEAGSRAARAGTPMERGRRAHGTAARSRISASAAVQPCGSLRGGRPARDLAVGAQLQVRVHVLDLVHLEAQLRTRTACPCRCDPGRRP